MEKNHQRSGEFGIRPLQKKKWKTIRSEYLFRRPWLTARLDQIELPDGRIIPEYYVLEYPDWVNVIAITRDGQFVMERQFRYAAQLDSIELPMRRGQSVRCEDTLGCFSPAGLELCVCQSVLKS